MKKFFPSLLNQSKRIVVEKLWHKVTQFQTMITDVLPGILTKKCKGL